MVNVKRVSMPTQLVCVLPPIPCKVMQYLCGWSSRPSIKLYIHQMARAMNLADEEVELAIQTLSNVNLIEIGKEGDTYVAKINAAQVQKYFEVPFQRIVESDGIQNATEITWKENRESSTKQGDIAELSTKDLQRLLLRIEAQLNERAEVKKVVVTPEKDNDITDLPF